MQNRYDIGSPVFKTLSVASFLDPRFKQRHLENKEEIVTRIIDECIGSFVSSDSKFYSMLFLVLNVLLVLVHSSDS